MAAVRYTALRSIIGGHSVDTVYELTLQLRDLDESSRPVRDESTALDGSQETIRHRTEKMWRAATIPLTVTERAALEEFLDSVDGGETFQFDPDNPASSSPDNMRDCVMESKGHSWQRAVRRGDGGGSDRFTVSFQMRELP